MTSSNVLRLASLGLVVILSGCAAATESDHIGFEEARRMFESRGVQPGQPLPALSLVELNGLPASIASIQRGRPLVLVTASLTCNVARRQQPDVDKLAQELGDTAAVVVVYTIDAHPKGDVCPYTGKEWVPGDNERDAVLVRQPTTLDDRLRLARDYQSRFAPGAHVVVDTIDNASWAALGKAPNLGVLVGTDGLIRLRQGWFDAKAMKEALADVTAVAPGE